ncbi:MAG: serine/threonine-protein kinase, partial [Actinocatenispora sp.]
APVTGDLIAGRYRLDEQVGLGGMGLVWRAVDEELDRVVAMKRSHVGGDAEAERTRQEARLAAGLQHPHVVTLFDVVTEGTDRWLVMEYLPSRSLAELVDSRVPLPAWRVAYLGAQLADALEALHAKGIVHCDIKPGNVLVTPDDTAKLIDFGISRRASSDGTLPARGRFGGTPWYRAPEVVHGHEPTPASDLYSLGVTLYAAVEGMPAPEWVGDPRAELRYADAPDIPPPRLAGLLGPVLSLLLRTGPADRPDAAQARRMLAELAPSAPVRLSRRASPGGVRRGTRRRIARLAPGVVVALVGTLLLAARGDGHPLRGVPQPATPAAIGDPRTADPCALLDRAAMGRFGTADLETDYGNFNRCDVIVRSSGGDEVDVRVEFEPSDPDDAASFARPGPGGTLGILREREDDGTCDRTLLLPDHNLVALTVEQDGDGSRDLCPLADVATRRAASVLARGPVPRRRALAPAGSLARVDTCSLLDPAALASAPGVTTRSADRGFGGWECWWDSDTTDLSIQLRFDRDQPLTARDGPAHRWHGRSAVVEPAGDGDGTCLARVQQRSYRMRGRPTAEFVFLVVSGRFQASRLCELAGGLARAAAARLPAP